jgi:hypothetical protein
VVIRGRSQKEDVEEDETALLNVSLADRPVVSLTPTSDGHYLWLKVEKIVIDAASVDYELLYQNKEGVTLGVPGMQELEGIENFDVELLLGSESSGKFRYDEGVKEGSVILRFRNDQGKLLAKFESEFRLYNDVTELISPDGNVKVVLSDPTDDFFIVMESIGIPNNFPTSHEDILDGPYGLFSSAEVKNVEMVEVSKGNTFGYFNQKWTNELPNDFDSLIIVGTKSPLS